jgi:ubiquinone/menaquinone biosynthesis C-methylase UbiE
MATHRQPASQDGGTYGSAATAEAWRRGAAARAQAMGPVTERMLDLAGIGVGCRVLDVAAGSGEQTLMAARRVGLTGSVLATDIAARMLAGAAEAAREAGLSNVETYVTDARDLGVEPDSFDAAISRLALMLIPQREQALAGIRRALRPGGKLAASVLSTAEENPYTALPLAIARRHAGLPPLPFEDPGMFALGDPAVLRRAYEQAGFREVSVEALSGARRFASAPEAVQARRDSGPEASKLMAELSDAEREAAWAEVEEAFRRFEGEDGIVLPIEWLIGVGTK